MVGRLEISVSTGTRAATTGARAPQEPMRLLLLGDFSGRPAHERPVLAARPTHRVDIDSLGSVMQRLRPLVPAAGSVFEAEDIEDFHPDALFARVPVFETLRSLRRRLQDPLQFATAAAELGVPLPAAGVAPAAGAGDLLAGLLGGRPAAATPHAASPPEGIDAFVRSLVAPHIVPDHGPMQAQLTASVDRTIAAQMRALLHAPAFQALESAWRGTQWLISTLELDEQLQLHLFDVGRDELLADVVASRGQLAQTGLHRALADRWRGVPGGESWSAVVSLERFGPADTDIGLLAALGLLAQQAGGPLLAGGDPALALADPAALAGWHTLRQSEAAPWIGLAAPRVLLRRPYGKRSDPVAAFAFEEFTGPPEHENLLWGAGSLAAALLIGRAYMARGWAMEPGDEREIGDLPAYSFERNGEMELQACAEDYLGEQAGQALLAAGLMPLMSHRHRNAATLMRFQSIAEPAQPLAALGGRP
ncbi:MAG: type VI secretion system contractile sheath large subunit [Rubrivivax sp.]|nr:type VI secretion system contractile sheath large subunit [Rubrivivax sp.]